MVFLCGPAPVGVRRHITHEEDYVQLAFNSYVYEVAQWPIAQTLESASRFGFRHVEYAACGSGDPTRMSPAQRRDVVRRFRDLGLYCAQMLLIETEHTASADSAVRESTLDYMKACTDFLLELGGRQALICWGNGVYSPDVPFERTYLLSIDTVRRYAEFCLDKGILVDFEIEPHVYFVSNSAAKAAQIVEDVGMPNVFPNCDIGHLCITREGPHRLDKLGKLFLQVHLSETDTYEHTNSILGTGNADFRAYVDKVIELGIEDNCRKYGEPCVAGIELGAHGLHVDNPDRWVRESIDHVTKVLPELALSLRGSACATA
ncbi:MAG: TIM barrel protein [Chitinivibrionales bacterium]|nr:TIM barrel protein [Chitinivibrionales bacterium]